MKTFLRVEESYFQIVCLNESFIIRVNPLGQTLSRVIRYKVARFHFPDSFYCQEKKPKLSFTVSCLLKIDNLFTTELTFPCLSKWLNRREGFDVIYSPKHEDFVRLNMADSVYLVLCAHPDVCVCEVINLGALYYKELRNLIGQLSKLHSP